ncbi:MAG: carbohydrate binding domain-containing protein [Candidatus Ratteibacteria bacterium]
MVSHKKIIRILSGCFFAGIIIFSSLEAVEGGASQTPSLTNVLKNGSFEESTDLPSKGFRLYFLKDWDVLLNSGVAACGAELSEDAYDGKHSLKFITKKIDAFISAQQKIEAKSGQEVTASVYVKGTPGAKAYMRFYLYDTEGNRMKKYFMPGLNATETWRPLKTKFTVPEGVTSIIASVQTLANKKLIEVYFDKFEVSVSSGAMLENSLLNIQINPLVGGCINSFVEKKGNIDFTLPNLPTSTGGMALEIIPGTRTPGFLRLEKYDLEVVRPYQEIRLSRVIPSGPFQGLKVIKTFQLEEDSSEVKVGIELINTSTSSMEVNYRVQNCLNPADGIFSWPSADWLQAFRKTPESVQTINAIITENLRSGWCAKTFTAAQRVLLFQFAGEQSLQSYSWVSKNIDTAEWYYRPKTMAPGEVWKSTYSITVLPASGDLYTGGMQERVVYVEGVKLPEPEQRKPLPKVMQGYFPFGASGPALVHSASAGGSKTPFREAYQRIMREMAYGYFNFFYTLRTMQEAFQSQLFYEDGTSVVGELARDYDMMLAPSHILIDKDEVDVEQFRPALAKRMAHYYNPTSLKFIKDYKDRILCYFTADEIQTHNIPCMLEAHYELSKIAPDQAYFPYQNISTTSYIPYVPVFLGDWYPIKRTGWGGRDPWSMARMVSTAVKEAGEAVPVWVMPQGFGYRGTGYALPTSAEMRLMLYTAVGNGAKGIIFHGYHNRGLSWRMNYGYVYTPYGNAGERAGAWHAISECARELTSIGPLLYYTHPEDSLAGMMVNSAVFQDKKGFYKGPAMTAHSLKKKDGNGRFLMVINQDIFSEQAGTISFSEGLEKQILYNLTKMKQEDVSKPLTLTLGPGDGAIYFLGTAAESAQVAQNVFENRYLREKVRYYIDAVCAEKNSIPITKASSLFQKAEAHHKAGKNDQAYRTILQAESMLQEIQRNTALGKSMEGMEHARKLLDEITFLFTTHFDLVVPPEIVAKTPRHRDYKNTNDVKMQGYVDNIVQDFTDFWRLDQQIREGGFEKVRTQIDELLAKIPVHVKEATDYLNANAHKITIDNPYGD